MALPSILQLGQCIMQLLCISGDTQAFDICRNRASSCFHAFFCTGMPSRVHHYVLQMVMHHLPALLNADWLYHSGSSCWRADPAVVWLWRSSRV